MFETERRETEGRSWSVFIISAVVLALILGGIVYFLVPLRVHLDVPEGVFREGSPDFDWYNQYVDLTNVRIQMAQNFAGHPMVFFSGLIENNGEKQLDVVELRLLFFNFEEPVWETIRYPIRPGPGNYTPPIPPFSARGFTLYIENLSDDWHASHAEMEINGFRFVEVARRR